MVSKLAVVCALALLIQSTISQSLRSENCKPRSSNGSGSVRAIGIGSFKGGKFVGNTEPNCDRPSPVCSNQISVQNDVCCVCEDNLSVNHPVTVSKTGTNCRSIVTRGGPLSVTCYGPLAPKGISVEAYNDLIGDLVITGSLPFLSAVGFEGAFRTESITPVSYGCGDGNIAVQQIIGAQPGSCGYIL